MMAVLLVALALPILASLISWAAGLGSETKRRVSVLRAGQVLGRIERRVWTTLSRVQAGVQACVRVETSQAGTQQTQTGSQQAQTGTQQTQGGHAETRGTQQG